MLEMRPMSHQLGVEILGADLDADLDPSTVRAILAALHENGAILFRNQSITPEGFERLSRHFGQAIPHVLDHLRLPGHPDIFTISNDAQRPDEIRNGAAYWHTDQSYDTEPSSATMLYAIQVPQEGGETMLADMFGAYDALPEATKGKIDGLTVLHHYGNRDAGKDGQHDASPLLNDDQKAQVPPVHHPLVRPHPVTGRKALYGVAGTSFGIVGLPDDEACGLLDELKAHAISPRFVHAHRHRVGNVLIWDGASTLHAGTPIAAATGAGDTRLMHRISVRGIPPLLRKAA